MGYQLTGIDGVVTSWGSSGDDCYHLIATGTTPRTITINTTADLMNITGQGDTSRKHRTGLRSWTGSISALFPKTSRKIGAEGIVTYASGYVQHVDGWTLNLSWPALDITELGSAPTWRSFRPGKIGTFTGSYTGRVDSATALALPTPWTSSSAAATFKLTEEGATDNQVTCNIIVTGVDYSVPVGEDGLQTYTVNFAIDGDLTIVGSSNFLPSGTVGTPAWDANGDGTPDREIVVTLATGRTFTSNAFISGLTVNVPAGDLITVEATVQGAGAVTVA
jgi:hypothetical protein